MLDLPDQCISSYYSSYHSFHPSRHSPRMREADELQPRREVVHRTRQVSDSLLLRELRLYVRKLRKPRGRFRFGHASKSPHVRHVQIYLRPIWSYVSFVVRP